MSCRLPCSGKSTHKGLPGPLGKILAGIWLAFGVGIVAYITSSVTSVMTVNRLQGNINGPQDLPSHHVGAIRGILAEKYCQDQHLNTTLYITLPQAVKAMLHHEIDTIVFDALALQWYDNAHPDLPITEVGPIFIKKVMVLLFRSRANSDMTLTAHSSNNRNQASRKSYGSIISAIYLKEVPIDTKYHSIFSISRRKRS